MKEPQKYSRYSILLYLLLISLPVAAQVNYVQNPSFEQYSKCPYENDQIRFANFWSAIDSAVYPPIDSFGNPSCTPNYCNECAGTNNAVGVPRSDKFFHYPRIGKGMVEVLIFNNDRYITDVYRRDYLQGRLYQPLTAGKSYCVTFYTTLEQAYGYATNHIGAYLDNGSMDTTQNCGSPQITHTPQVQTLDIINDTLNWVKIEGSFIANGTEKFITIGNFYDNAHTDIVTSNPYSIVPYLAVYLIDDVSVVESDIPAYAGGTLFKGKNDSVFVGRNEIVPDCEWYRNGVLIDTVHAGFWVKDTANTTYVVKQSICGNVLYDTAWVLIAPESVGSVGNAHAVKIYPNPATKEITIQTVNDRSTAALAIYDMSGRVMLRQDVQFVGGEVRVPIDLVSGVYMVELMTGDGGRVVERLGVL